MTILLENVAFNILIMAVAFAVLFKSADLFVESAAGIAAHFNLPKMLVGIVIIGLTIVAIGTSLPEISTCIIAGRKGQGEIAVGDIIGADILNILWIIGVSVAIQPMHLKASTVYFSFGFMFLIVGTMLVSLRMGYGFGRRKGFVLLAIYLVYLFFNYQLHFLAH
jgi:cation:H+ antiporter